MSFSQQVKDELEKHMSTSRHCQIAEMSAYIANFGELAADGTLMIRTENEAIIRKTFTLLKKTYNIYSVVEETVTTRVAKEKAFCIMISDPMQREHVLQSVKPEEMHDRAVSGMLLKNACCRRAYLRGCFLCLGSMSNPDKSYHLEFVCFSEPQAMQVQELLKDFEIEAKITRRKKYFVVYLKEGEAIVELLNIMSAHLALMELENLRIMKDVRNTVNRRVNCDTANIQKMLSAAQRQVKDITYLKEHLGLQTLPDSLRQMAEVRLENPDMPLKDLGEMMNPPIGKSGVNHRLRKLSEMAEDQRNR